MLPKARQVSFWHDQGKTEILMIPNPLWSGQDLELEEKNSKPGCVRFLPVTALRGFFM